MSRFKIAVIACVIAGGAVIVPAHAGPMTFRFYQGVTVYVNNADGRAFDIDLTVRDWNTFESGPREMLFKVYDPSGKPVVREVIEDDGVAATTYLPKIGGWDHEMWYYMLCYSRGSMPMMRWSAFSDPQRLASLAKRTFKRKIAGGQKGVYRIVMVGSRDHVATLTLDPLLPHAVSGHPLWLHGRAEAYKRSYIYVPKGTVGLHLGFVEFDQPQTRTFKITAPGGKVLFEGDAKGGLRKGSVMFAKPGQYDDQVLTLDVGPGDNDYMLHILLNRRDTYVYRGSAAVAAVLAPDPKTARAVRGGAIYHDGKVFWHRFQIRLHDWLKALKDEDFIVRDAKGDEIKPTTSGRTYGWSAKAVEYRGLPTRRGFRPLNGGHEAPPLCDTLMHSYPAHRNRNVLNVAIRDLARGLHSLATGDHCTIGGWGGNFGYVFGTYGWHFWRPAWRVIQQSDAPRVVKDAVREALIIGGDRLAFGRGIERVNGNAFAHVPTALRYCYEGTGDAMQRELFETYWRRFVSEGWGPGTGISRSGDLQEHFGHDFHYGSYVMATFAAVIEDFKDPRFQQVRKRLVNQYSYTFCRFMNAYPWSARTAHGVGEGTLRAAGFKWRGDPGPDFTVNVNDGGEWFAARRKNYYVLTFHGRLAPTWLDYYFNTRIGYGGGILCQLTVPGKGTVIGSMAKASYGKGMHPRNWRTFHLHSVVGTLADGRAFVAADSEHLGTAKLVGNTVTSDGEVRNRPVHVTRSYTFAADRVRCRVQLADTMYRTALWGGGPTSKLTEAYEMIPFSGKATALDARGKEIGALAAEAVEAKAIRIDCKGYGARIELPRVMSVQGGQNATILLRLIDKPTRAQDIGLQYEIVPFGN